MPRKTWQEGSEIVHEYDLAVPGAALDVTANRWHLRDGQASVLDGMDVTRQGTIRPDRGRKPVGTSLPAADLPITSVMVLGFEGSAAVRYKDVARQSDYYQVVDQKTIYKTQLEYDATGAWPSEMVGSFIVKNGDNRRTASEIRAISSITKTINTDDTLNWLTSWSTIWNVEDKFYILYPKTFNKSGVWVSNGRKFWLLKDGVYTQYLDLGGDTYLGERWNSARIANGLIMFVNPKYPPRIVHLSESTSIAVSDNRTLAGLITPIKPPDLEPGGDDEGNENNSIRAVDGGTGSLTAGTYRVKVRAVNLEDSASSRFVNAYDEIDKDDIDIDQSGSGGIRLQIQREFGLLDGDCPPVHERWTHIEVWRTLQGGIDYYLETRIEIANLVWNENWSAANNRATQLIQSVPDNADATPVQIDDTDAPRLPGPANANDILSGYPPPICRRVVSLNGVTLCFGKADPERVDPVIDGIALFNTNMDYDDAGGAFEHNVSLAAGNAWADYTFQTGDRLVITSPNTHIGTYAITTGSTSNDLGLETSAGADVNGTVDAYIRHAYTIEWPFVQSDEQVWYSRTDEFAPESFLTRTMRLSFTGDTFRNVVSVLNYAAVTMDQGVHLLYLSGTTLVKDTVSEFGDGTPWEDSVIVIGNQVIWATPEGPKIMAVSNGVNNAGHRGTISLMPGAERMRQWFFEAHENGETIDAGVDERVGCMRFRRKIDANTYQSIQLNYRTGQWTVIHDDAGILYVASDKVETGGVRKLYSVSSTGNVFEVNASGTTHPYDDSTVQDVLGASYDVISGTKIGKMGAFSASMAGDVVRFRNSDNEDVDGVSRVIRTATANEITFDLIDGLVAGDEFIIGANRFKWRPAAITGNSKLTNKILEGITVRALPGPNSDSDDLKAITVRVYENYDDDPAPGEQSAVGIYDTSSVEFTSVDRQGGLEGSGNAIEVEIEAIESRLDFSIESLSAKLREDGDTMMDVASSGRASDGSTTRFTGAMAPGGGELPEPGGNGFGKDGLTAPASPVFET